MVESLTHWIDNTKESKVKANEASEIARLRAEELVATNMKSQESGITVWQIEFDFAREHHSYAATELEAAKQEPLKVYIHE